MEYPKHFPLHILGSCDLLEDTNPPRNILPSLSEKAKGKQPAPKTIPLFKIPHVSILHIPVATDAPLKRVKVSLRGDTATRHWQTFFFKNIVCLEPFWGATNDKAFVATRIVRLKMEDGKPTPYFLMVCIGEWPRIKSPRNNNEIFKGMYVPIYNDAFVFKLGDPELGVAGYANYVDMEKDIDGIDWLRQAIRDAATKVEWAMARHANPGFPDMSNYADEETMSKDVRGMLYVIAMISKARKKHAAADPIDAELGVSDLESMRDRVETMLRQIRAWKNVDLLSFEGAVEAPLDQATNACFQKATEFNEVIEEALDQIPSFSKDVDSPSVKTEELWARAKECFMGVKSAYESVAALVKKDINDKNREAPRINDHNAEYNPIRLKYSVESMLVNVVELMTHRNVITALKSGDQHVKKVYQLGVKAQAACQAIEENKTYHEIMKLVIEATEINLDLCSGPESEGL